MSSSLKQKYNDRSARVGQFLVLSALFSAGIFYFVGEFLGGEMFFQISKFMAANAIDKNIPVEFSGQHFRAGEMLNWASANWPETAEKVKVFFYSSIPVGLTLSSAIFLYFWKRKQTKKTETEHVRGARILTDKELKKEMGK